MGTFWSFFDHTARAFPKRLFLVSPELQLNYQEAHELTHELSLDIDSDPTATQLAPGDLVGVGDSLGTWEVLAMLAASRRDLCVVPYSERDAGDVERVQRLGVRRTFTRNGQRVRCESWTANPHRPHPRRTDRDLAYILGTSGSTGSPKHVAISNRNVEAYARHVASLDVDSSDVVAQVYRPQFDAYYNVLLMATIHGATMAVPSRGTTMLISDVIRDYGVTIWDSVPSLMRLAHRAGKLAPRSAESVRLAIFGGEGLRLSDVELWREAAPRSTIVNAYGPSECTISVCEYRFGPGEAPLTRHGYVAIGKPIGETQLRLAPRPEGGLELRARGPQRFAGYLDGTDQKCFVDDGDHFVSGSSMADWYCTGDLATEENGYLFYQGRTNQRPTKVLGQRFDPIQIERALELNPAVSAAFAHVVKDRVVAVLEPRAEHNTVDRIECPDLKPHAQPHRLIWVARFPYLPSGKVDVGALIRLAESSGPTTS